MSVRIKIKAGRSDYKAPGCRWLDTAYNDVWVVKRVWKNAIELRNVCTGTTARFGRHDGMSAANGWYPLTGLLFKRSHDLLEHDMPLPENVAIIAELAAALAHQPLTSPRTPSEARR